MKLAAAIIVIFGVLAIPGYSQPDRCVAGAAQAFVAIRTDPPHLVGTIPSKFTTDQGYFSRRYNCRRMSAAVRRVSLGIYDVRFPGLSPEVVLVSALSQEGVTASAIAIGGGVVRVALRGPILASDVASRRDVPFALTVF